MVLEKQKPTKFFEWGVVKNTFQYVVAYKSPYYDKEGNLLGTTGIAIYVTDEVNTLIDILNSTNDEATKNKLKKYLQRYGFEQDVFTDQNVENLWEKR